MIITFDPDCKVIDFIKRSGFATSDQIRDLFFQGRSGATRQKLSRLQRKGKLKSMLFIKAFDRRKVIPVPLLSLRKKKVYFVDKKYFLKEKRHLLIHQILLNSCLVRLEKIFPESEVLFKGELSSLDYEMIPDASLKIGKNLIALELERSQKSVKEYFKKANFYRKSSFSHLLYFALTKRTKKALFECFQGNPNTAIFLYEEPLKVYSSYKEVMGLREWFEWSKKNKIGL